MEEIKKEITPNVTLQEKTNQEFSKVVVEKDWKEYLGESILIIFSVALALFLTEVFNNLHEKQQVREILRQLQGEITENKKAAEEQYLYHRQVLNNIDSALAKPELAKDFINDNGINLKSIAPLGILRHDLNDVAWLVAKQKNIFSKVDLDTYGLLTQIYNNQERITKSEEQIARVLLSWESRKPENLRTTLILMRDNYHGWAVDRAPGLIKLYQQAIDKLN